MINPSCSSWVLLRLDYKTLFNYWRGPWWLRVDSFVPWLRSSGLLACTLSRACGWPLQFFCLNCWFHANGWSSLPSADSPPREGSCSAWGPGWVLIFWAFYFSFTSSFPYSFSFGRNLYLLIDFTVRGTSIFAQHPKSSPGEADNALTPSVDLQLFKFELLRYLYLFNRLA